MRETLSIEGFLKRAAGSNATHLPVVINKSERTAGHRASRGR